MDLLTECPVCGHIGESDNVVTVTDRKLMTILQICGQCGECYEDHYTIHWLGRTSHGCNMFPAPGETEESMIAAGVDLED